MIGKVKLWSGEQGWLPGTGGPLNQDLKREGSSHIRSSGKGPRGQGHEMTEDIK